MDPESSPLLSAADGGDGGPPSSNHRRSRWIIAPLAVLLAAAVLLALLAAGPRSGSGPQIPIGDIEFRPSIDRGVSSGVSDKSSGVLLSSAADGFAWTNDMLVWQRTAFHFQPEKNWMNDPNGPLFYKGWYHLFYQYNPDSAIWGNITWGHAVSRDLIRWQHLPLAMVADRWYDANGVWTGSATFLPDGRIAMLYTGSTNESVQVQNLAFPADPADPLLLRWSKSESNPVLLPPPGVGPKDFRDPTTAWFEPSDSTWRFAIGSKEDRAHSGVAFVYRTRDFIHYDLLPGLLHQVPGTGMWECVDFYPVATETSEDGEGGDGLDTSARPGPGVRHVLKASMDDDRHDYYAIGRYDPGRNKWVPDDAEADVGLGLRYDWGKFYASKTFYDQHKRRRVLWGWVGETDSERADLKKGWASLQAIPRTVQFDSKTGSNLLQWPVEEVESLRMNHHDFRGIRVGPGTVFRIDARSITAQLDIEAEFEIKGAALAAVVEADVGYNCSTSGGAAHRGLLGPFGLLVLADKDRSEQTATYFYISRGVDGGLRTHFCQDESRPAAASITASRRLDHRRTPLRRSRGAATADHEPPLRIWADLEEPGQPPPRSPPAAASIPAGRRYADLEEPLRIWADLEEPGQPPPRSPLAVAGSDAGSRASPPAHRITSIAAGSRASRGAAGRRPPIAHLRRRRRIGEVGGRGGGGRGKITDLKQGSSCI